MALQTKSKTKNNRVIKRNGQHHKKTTRYAKIYHPYLTIFAVIASGIATNQVWTVSNGVASADPVKTTRLATLTGSKSLTDVYIVLGITFAAFLIFFVSHWWRIHRLLNRGEEFVTKHPWFDIGLVFVITAGVVLTRTY